MSVPAAILPGVSHPRATSAELAHLLATLAAADKALGVARRTGALPDVMVDGMAEVFAAARAVAAHGHLDTSALAIAEAVLDRFHPPRSEET
jgi:hypothetical protein